MDRRKKSPRQRYKEAKRKAKRWISNAVARGVCPVCGAPNCEEHAIPDADAYAHEYN